MPRPPVGRQIEPYNLEDWNRLLERVGRRPVVYGPDPEGNYDRSDNMPFDIEQEDSEGELEDALKENRIRPALPPRLYPTDSDSE